MENKRNLFSLVELIIVIVIIAILTLAAFMMLTKWLVKSEDSRKIADLYTFKEALILSIKENKPLNNYLLVDKMNFNEIFNYDNHIKCYSYRSASGDYFCKTEKNNYYLFTLLNDITSYGDDQNYKREYIKEKKRLYRDAYITRQKETVFVGTGSFVINFNKYIDRNFSEERIYLKELENKEKRLFIKNLLMGEKINNIDDCYIIGYRSGSKGEYLFTNTEECDSGIMNLSELEISFLNENNNIINTNNGLNEDSIINNLTTGNTVFEKKNQDSYGYFKSKIFFEVDEREYESIDKELKGEKRLYWITIYGSLLAILLAIPFIAKLFGIELNKKTMKSNKKVSYFYGFFLCVIVFLLLYNIFFY